ncbi:ABC transporter substrate-binding protein [Nocardioides sp. Bht2]|uniref:ABC transporter substrate-binding protein n=1 Tax=Nocardioides sp. Bht2 TaxID=3392297 RepID=UPI0039B5AC03
MSAVVALGLASALAACGSEASDNTGEVDLNATLRFGMTYGTSSYDPHKTLQTSDNNLLFNVYDRLIQRTPDGDLIPGLAESWETDASGKVMTLKIRKGVKFQDGAVLDAEAVKINLDRAKEPDSNTAPLLASIESVDVVDESTVALNLDGFGAALPQTLTDLAGMIVSPKALAKPDAAEFLATTPAGAGRYKLKSAKPGAHYEFTAFDGYWNADAVKAKNLVWEVMPDATARLNALKSGQLDIALIAPTIIGQAEQDKDLTVQIKPSLTHYMFYFNQQKAEFDKVEVRQAIAKAINKDAIVEAAFEGQAVAASQDVPKDYFAYNPSLESVNTYDPDGAKALLEQAGLKDGFSFTAMVMNIPEYVVMAEMIQSDLAKIGIKMEMTMLPPSDLAPTFNKGEGDATISAWVGRPDPSILYSSYFLKDSVSNPSKSEVDGIRAALDKANSVYDDKGRAAAMGEVSAMVIENALVVPVAFMVTGAIHTKDVLGFDAYAIGVELREAGLSGKK